MKGTRGPSDCIQHRADPLPGVVLPGPWDLWWECQGVLTTRLPGVRLPSEKPPTAPTPEGLSWDYGGQDAGPLPAPAQGGAHRRGGPSWWDWQKAPRASCRVHLILAKTPGTHGGPGPHHPQGHWASGGGEGLQEVAVCGDRRRAPQTQAPGDPSQGLRCLYWTWHGPCMLRPPECHPQSEEDVTSPRPVPVTGDPAVTAQPR